MSPDALGHARSARDGAGPQSDWDAIASGGLILFVPTVAALCACCRSRCGSKSEFSRSPTYCTFTAPRRRRSVQPRPVRVRRCTRSCTACSRPASASNPARDAHRPAGTEPSARTGLAVVRSASAPLLCLCGAKTRFCLLGGAFELAQARQAGGAWSVHLGLVELVTLAGVLSLYSQIVQMPGGHGLQCRAGRRRRGASAVALRGQRRASRRPLTVLGGV